MNKHRIIIDTDIGADDAAALIMAAVSENVDILGITAVCGNVPVEYAAKNALMVMELCGCDAPVFLGSHQPLKKEKKFTISVHGEDGMGDQDLIHPKKKPEKKDAVDFILDTIRENPGEIEIVAIGPLTNIAKAVQKDPDTMKKLKRLWVMGTTGFGPGNATPVAEFNVYIDAEAYQIVFDAELPMTVAGLDLILEETCVTGEDLEAMKHGNKLGQFMSKAFTKLFAFNQSMGKPMAVPDALAMAALAWPGYVLETVPCYGVACTDDNVTYGQVLFYRKGMIYEAMPEIRTYHCDVITKTDSTLYKRRFMELMCGEK